MLTRRRCCCGGYPCLPCDIPEKNLTLSITSLGTQTCFDSNNGSVPCGPTIVTGSETLVWGGGHTWTSATPEAFICPGCVYPQNSLADVLSCGTGTISLSLFAPSPLLHLTLNFAGADSYTCSPFIAEWTITALNGGTAYTYGLRSVILSE